MAADWRRWFPDVTSAVVVLVVGVVETSSSVHAGQSRLDRLAVTAAIAVAVGLGRRAPGVALTLVWAVCAVQLALGVPVMLVELAAGAVAFATARWGGLATVWLSGLSVPLAVVVALAYVRIVGLRALLDVVGYRHGLEIARLLGSSYLVLVAAVAAAALGLPWLSGLSLRLASRARASTRSQLRAEEDAARAVYDTEQAQQIAQLREDQARMARDVHDVVGHSLAVILAQAESGHYLADGDSAALKQTMANIALSARSSLQDVRQVLTTTSEHPAPVRPGGFDTLVDGVRASGHDVASTTVGSAQPLPPELDIVAYRVLQEMLTNAIKHGQRGTVITVERHWAGELRIEVHNVADDARGVEHPDPVDVTRVIHGQGVDGMRRRLESVGGRLDVRRRHESAGLTYTATAWLPVHRAGL